MSALPTIAAQLRARYKVVEADRLPWVATAFGNRRWWDVTLDGRNLGGSSVKRDAIRSVDSSIKQQLRLIRRAARTLREVGYEVIPPSRRPADCA